MAKTSLDFVSFQREGDDDTKKKKKKSHKVSSKYSMDEMKKDAENYKGFYQGLKRFAILSNVDPKKYKESMKTLKKLYTKLEEGRGEEVYDEERYNLIMNRNDE